MNDTHSRLPTTPTPTMRPPMERHSQSCSAAPKRGCLKSCHPSPTGTPSPTPTPAPMSGSSSSRKSVVFCDEEQYDVWDADDWDRTPCEPARALSYQDLLELKAIQRLLPRANQPSDPYTRKPASHYLSKVPLGLLPLSDAGSAPGRYPELPDTPNSTPTGSGTSTPYSSSASKKNFSFLPLLDRPEAHYSPNAIANHLKLHAVASPTPVSPLLLDAGAIPGAAARKDVLTEAKPIAKRKPRNVMYINGEEVSLDDDDDEEEEEEVVEEPSNPEPASPPPAPPDPVLLPACSFRARRNTPPSVVPIPAVFETPSPTPAAVEAPDPVTLPACSFRARRAAQPVPSTSQIFPPPPTPQAALTAVPPPPPPMSVPPSTISTSSQISSHTSPISLPISSPTHSTSQISFRVSSPPGSRVTSPPPTSPRQIKVVRASRDNPNPSGMVGLSGWRPSGRQSPVLVPSA